MGPNGKTRIALPLTLREGLHGLWAGIRGLPWETYQARISSATLDGPAGQAGAARQPRVESRARTRVLAAEAKDLARRRGKIDGELTKAQARERKAAEAYTRVLAARPASGGMRFWIVLAVLCLPAEFAFNALALADSFGVDVTADLGTVPPYTLILVGGMSLLASLGTVWSGVLATDPGVPLRRYGGWALCILLAVGIVALRGASAAEATWALGFLGGLLCILAAMASGEAHHRWQRHRQELGVYETQVEGKRSELRGAQARVAEIEAALADSDNRRRGWAVEKERLERAPELQAELEAERQKLLTARQAAARHIYEVGAYLAGHKRPGPNGKGDRHA